MMSMIYQFNDCYLSLKLFIYGGLSPYNFDADTTFNEFYTFDDSSATPYDYDYNGF